MGIIAVVTLYLERLNLNKYKIFSIFFTILILASVLFHYITWNLISKKALIVNNQIFTGDIARVLYKLDSIYYRPSYLNKSANNLKKKHLNFIDINNAKIDIITIGDSFSNAATQGINPYYQDYIATMNEFNVLNINPFANYNEIIYILNNSGLLDDLKPKAIILESVERAAIQRFTSAYNTEISVDKTILLNSLSTYQNPFIRGEQHIKFINNNNFKAFYNNVKLKLNKYYFFPHVRKLNRDFFSVAAANDLLFIDADLKHIPYSTKTNLIVLNNYMNNLAKMLKQKNITLYFMPAVDKYNLYEPYIVNNEYPKSTFFEYLRELPKEYKLIDTKAILKKELELGIQDIFYADDTHWSYKASEAIFRKVKFDK